MTRRMKWVGIGLFAWMGFLAAEAPAHAQQPGSTPPASDAKPPAGDKPAGDKPAGDKPAGDKPGGDKDVKPPTGAGDTPASSGAVQETTGPAAAAGDSPPSGTTAAGPAAPEGGMDGATYAVRLRDLEQKIDELKEQIRRSHTRLSLLSDTILSGGGAGSRAIIRFRNALESSFRVTKALFVLDSAVQYNKTDQSGALAEQEMIPIFNGSIPPGDHTLQVLINLQGHGYGVFSYLRGYKFEVRSSHSFTAVEGKTISLDAVAYEKGGVTTPLEERPAIRYAEKIQTGLADPKAAVAKPAAE